MLVGFRTQLLFQKFRSNRSSELQKLFFVSARRDEGSFHIQLYSRWVNLNNLDSFNVIRFHLMQKCRVVRSEPIQHKYSKLIVSYKVGSNTARSCWLYNFSFSPHVAPGRPGGSWLVRLQPMGGSIAMKWWNKEMLWLMLTRNIQLDKIIAQPFMISDLNLGRWQLP